MGRVSGILESSRQTARLEMRLLSKEMPLSGAPRCLDISARLNLREPISRNAEIVCMMNRRPHINAKTPVGAFEFNFFGAPAKKAAEKHCGYRFRLIQTRGRHHTSQIVTPCFREASASGRLGMNSCATWPLKPVSTMAFMTAG